MDALDTVKSEASRRHPEDANLDEGSDAESNTSSHNNHNEKPEYSSDFDIPGSGPNDMPLFKHSTQLSGSYQTGVKGVIADATSFESARRRNNRRDPYGASFNSDYSAPADSRTPLARGDRGSDDGSGDDDDFVRTWRKNRLQELRTGVATTRRQSPSKRKYGRVEAVDAAGYLDAVERVSSETIVVVTVYNDESDESRFVEDCLNTLSRRYVTTRFVKLHHVEAEMESSVVPAVLAYKGGELFANIMRIVDEIPPGRNLSAESLELVLRRANVLHKD